MMLANRISAFCKLGEEIGALALHERQSLAEKASHENTWFTEDNVMLALKGIEVILSKSKLSSWAISYSPEPIQPRTVGVAMA